MKTIITHVLSMMLVMSVVISCGGDGAASSDNTSSNSNTSANNNTGATPPVITIQGDDPETITKGTAYIDAGATAVSADGETINVTSTGLVDVNTVGSYTITYSATDSAGNTASTSRVVNVENGNGVIVTILGDSTLNVTKDSIYTDAGATAASTTDGAIAVTTTGSVDTSIVGTYIIEYSATDSTAQSTTEIRTVSVVADAGDVTLPILTILGNNPVSVGQDIPYVDSGATATDNVDTTLFISSTASSVNTAVVGTYFVRYYTTDAAGNSATAIRTVFVTDTIAPVITVIGSNPAIVIQNTEYNDAGATATDNIDATVNVTTSGIVDVTTVGSYTITYSASDATGNTATTTRTMNVIERGIEGYVYDYTTALGLKDTQVSSAAQTIISEYAGKYVIPVDGAFNNRMIVNFTKGGYAPTSKIALAGSSPSNRLIVNADMLPIALTDTYDSSQDFTVQILDSSARLIVSANTLVDSSGNVPTASITVHITPIDPALDIDLIPGDMTTSSGAYMSSYGAISLELVDAEGNDLSLPVGETATIRIPVSNKGTASLPATTPLFYYDFTQGYWIQEGTATLVNNIYYQGEVSHFGIWNAGDLYTTISVNGCVEDGDSVRVANALVKAEGFNYSGTASSLTDISGNFTVQVQKDSRALLLASTDYRVSNTIVVGDDESTSSAVTLVDCLKLGEDQITARLTWGKNPSDLDTHLVGPSDYHIYYVDKGSLISSPFAQLDVDDTTSYGPEVLTILSFPEVGTYHYAIYHFSGTSSISASPARVELTIAGQRTVFTPPPRQVDNKWWNVFDIVVDENGDSSITAVNTWGANEPTSSSSRQERMYLPEKIK
ncbi:MAG: immunoglobulin-like domain-containing protein [Thiotrichaceae bacterium]